MKYILKKIRFIYFLFLPFATFAQQIKLIDNKENHTVTVTVDHKPFTTLSYSDTLYKPFLYPIYASDGEVITRGFPIAPRANEPVDHPHHTGLWLNYESVNGLDFWNNSYAIPEEKNANYGWITNTSITSIKSGNIASLSYTAEWQNSNKKALLKETTTFHFSVINNMRIIDRITTLTASEDVTMPDVKDGFLGLRVAHELELPSKEDRQFTDMHGNVTFVKASADTLTTGNYLTSEGKQGDSAWGTRARWCMLYGKKGNDSISIVIIDHKKNIGYPTYWHARGYGLFAANPLGQKIFSNGKQTLNFSLKKGESVTFRYRIVINAAIARLTTETIEKLTTAFNKIND
ncbi:hypothetical protein BH11BAC6_BH11BAC6_11060 [soil metagenome]